MIDRTELDHIFKESFSDFKDTPSSDVWAGIETQLINSNKQLHKNRGRKKLLFTLLGFLLLGSTLYFLVPNSANVISTNENPHLSNSTSLNNVSSNKHTTDILQQNDIRDNNKHQLTEEISYQNKSFHIEKNNTQSNYIDKNSSHKPGSQINPNNLTKQEQNYNLGHPISTSKKSNYKLNHVENVNNINTTKSIHSIDYTHSVKKSTFSKDNIQNIKKERIQEISLLDFKSIKLFKTTRSPLDFMQSRVPIKIWTLQHTSFGHRLTIQAIYQYNHSYRYITGQGEEFFDQRERQGNASSYGLRMDININNSWRIQSGLDFQNQSSYRDKMVESKYIGNKQSETLLSTSFNTNKVLFTLNNSDNLNIGELVSISGVFRQETKWISIPLNLIYRINKWHFAFDLSSGISTNLFLSDKINFKESQGKTLDFKHTFSESSAQTYLSYNGAIMIHYLNHSSLDLYIGFHYQNAFTSATKSKTIKYFPYLYGIQVGGTIPISAPRKK